MTRVQKKLQRRAAGANAPPAAVVPNAPARGMGEGDTLSPASASASDILSPTRTVSPAPSPAFDASDAMRIRIEKPQGKVKRLFEELEEKSRNGGSLETFIADLMARGQTGDALRLVRFLAASDTAGSLRLDIWLGALLAAQGKRCEAHAALGHRGEATWSKYLEASQALAANHGEAALWLADEAVKREPYAAIALRQLALLHHTMNDPTATLHALARVAELEPLELEDRALRADASLRLGQWEKARPDAEALVAKRPDIGHFQAMLAAVYAEAGDIEGVRACCAKLPQTGLETHGGVRHLIHAACTVGDTGLLRLCHQQVLQTGYGGSEGFAHLVYTHAQQGDLALALSVARLAARMVPQSDSPYRMMGDILDAVGKHAEAAEAFANAIQRCKPDVALHLRHAEASFAAGHLKDAATAFKTILTSAPTHMPALRGMIAVLEARHAPPRELVDWLYKAHSQQAEDIDIAHAFVSAANHPTNRAYRRRALATLERLHAQHPETPLWRTVLANAVRQSDPERALLLAQGALDAAPEDESAQVARNASQAAVREQQEKRDYTLQVIPLPGASMQQVPPSRVTFVAFTQQITGVEVGKTHENRTAVRTADGTLYWAPWSVCGVAQSVGAVATLKAGTAFAVPEGIAERFNQLLASPVVGDAQVQDFCRIINKRGECFLSGGAVRDIIADPHNAQPRDIDLAVTIAPSLVRLTCGGLTGNTPGLKNRPNGVVSPYPMEYFGLVKYGTIEDGVVHPTCDVMSMRTFGALEPIQQVHGARQPVKPVAFGPDMHADALFRDFTCNALYYDPSTRILLDPTGMGKIDAQQRRLQLCSFEHIHKNESLGWRYLKMRQMGYVGTERTRRAMLSHFQHYMAQADAPAWLQRSLLRVFPVADDKAAKAGWYEKAADILKVDGLADASLLALMRQTLGVDAPPQLEQASLSLSE